jgi:membrane-associated phospholipid phosphatase
MRPGLAIILTLSVVAAPGSRARADDDPARAYRVSPAVDGAVTAVGAALWIGSELAKPALAPSTCRACAPNALDDSVARAARWSDLALPASVSDAGLVVLPLLSLGAVAGAGLYDGARGHLVEDLLLVAESAAVAQVLNQATKFAVGRERPFVHWLPEAEKRATPQPSDNNLSFFSGHTTFSFALVTSAWSVARHRGYRLATPILAAGAPLAAFVAYLRMAAGKHYLTDVAVGAVVGSACGVVVPMLHEAAPSPAAPTVSLVPLPGGAMAAATGSW